MDQFSTAEIIIFFFILSTIPEFSLLRWYRIRRMKLEETPRKGSCQIEI